jgi:hypothetical protein
MLMPNAHPLFDTIRQAIEADIQAMIDEPIGPSKLRGGIAATPYRSSGGYSLRIGLRKKEAPGGEPGAWAYTQ